MNLLEEIIADAVDDSKRLSLVLRRCKLLAAALPIKQLEGWLVHESNGYAIKDSLPDYRIWKVELIGEFAGSFGAAIHNAEIPSRCIPQSIREQVLNYENRDSVSKIENILYQKRDSSQLIITKPDLASVLGTGVYEGYNCLSCWARVGEGHLVETLNVVRNRILDFLLAIKKEYPSEVADALETPWSASAKGTKSQGLVQIFHNTIMGGNIGSMGIASGASIEINNTLGDFESLAAQLRQLKMSDGDIDELEQAISADPTPREPDQFGDEVSRWIGKMTAKAASGAWDIGICTASTILAGAIKHYYGWP